MNEIQQNAIDLCIGLWESKQPAGGQSKYTTTDEEWAQFEKQLLNCVNKPTKPIQFTAGDYYV